MDMTGGSGSSETGTARVRGVFRGPEGKERRALIVYVTAGHPDMEATVELTSVLEDSGADLIELGIPFSDPLADGPTIQAASQKALEKGFRLRALFAAMRRIRRSVRVPIVFMTYANPVFHLGVDCFADEARRCGADGVIIPDLPPQEASDLVAACRRTGLATIFFVSPTTDPRRLPRIRAAATGFLYYVSVTGVTGARRDLPEGLLASVRGLRKAVSLPVCVGFGVSTPDQARRIAGAADGVIVGSAVIAEIERALGPGSRRPEAYDRVGRFVRRFGEAVHGVSRGASS